MDDRTEEQDEQNQADNNDGTVPERIERALEYCRCNIDNGLPPGAPANIVDNFSQTGNVFTSQAGESPPRDDAPEIDISKYLGQ